MQLPRCLAYALCKLPFLWLAGTLVASLTVASLPAQALLDHGIDPAHLGKGDWIYQLPRTETRLQISTTQQLVNYEIALGMQWITVKCADGTNTNDWSQFNPTLIAQAHAAGLKIFGWAYVDGGTNFPGEINAALTCLDNGADGLIIDAESEYEVPGRGDSASQYLQGIRARYPHTFLALDTPYDMVSAAIHPNFPAAVFGYYCDAAMPQDYWQSFDESPAQMLSDTSALWTAWQNSLTGTNRQAIKPIVPIAQSFSLTATETGADVTNFFNALKTDPNPATAGGYQGLSFWNCQLRDTNMDAAIAGIGFTTTAAPAPQFKNIVKNDGGVELHLTANVGSTYAIEVSSDLSSWTQLSVVTNTSGDFTFTDAAATNQPRGYYRARLISP